MCDFISLTMDTIIYDVGQFCTYCELYRKLSQVIQSSPVSRKSSLKTILSRPQLIIQKSLEFHSPFSEFVKNNTLTLFDLDLFQIAYRQKISSIDCNLFCEQTLFFQKNSLQSVLVNVSKSSLVKQKRLRFEKPFSTDTEMNAVTFSKFILRSDCVTKSSKKLRFTLPTIQYVSFGDFIDDIQILLQFYEQSGDFFSEANPTISVVAQNVYYQKVRKSYDATITHSQKSFATYLRSKKISFNEALLLLKVVQRDWNTSELCSFQNENLKILLDDELYTQLIEKKCIQTGFFSSFSLTEESLANLFSIQNKLDKSEFAIEESTISFDMVSLLEKTKTQIFQVINQAKHAETIFTKWGLEKTISYGRGITLNFHGPPGTGKTLTAKAIASYLKKKILVVDFSQIESMWVGETEKNIVKVFEKAKKADAVLFFDEADSLTTKRSQASQNWVVSRTNTLLKELEKFEGVCIFATNFSQNYDEAFNRRLSAHIQFDLPNSQTIIHIFQNLFSQKNSLSSTVDFVEIAKQYEGFLSGGDVKNIVLNAARIAASDETNTELVIQQKHILDACQMVVVGKQNCVREQAVSYFG